MHRHIASRLTLLTLGLALVALAAVGSSTAFAQSKHETISAPAAGTPEYVVLHALKAARAARFDAYLDLLHPDVKSTPEEVEQRRRYEWSRFVKQAPWYLTSESPITFVIVRRDPQAEDSVKLFLKDQLHKDRMPTPVTLLKSGAEWKIKSNSL